MLKAQSIYAAEIFIILRGRVTQSKHRSQMHFGSNPTFALISQVEELDTLQIIIVANIYETLCQTPYMNHLHVLTYLIFSTTFWVETISSIFQMKTLWPRKVKNLTQDHMTGGWRAGMGGRQPGLQPHPKPPSHTALTQNLSVSDSSCVKEDLHVFYPSLLCRLMRPIQLTESVLSYCPSMPLTLSFTLICLCSYCSFCLECSLHFPLSTCHLLLLANTCSLLKIQFRVCYHLQKTPGCPVPYPLSPLP